MIKYFAKRLASSAIMLFLVSLVIFVVLRLLPGDPMTTKLGQADGLGEGALAEMRASLGLDQPILVQYWQWISGMFRGDFGFSYFSNFPVSTLVGQRLPPTLELAGAGLVIGILIALIAAILPIRFRTRALRRIVDGFTAFGLSAPPFVIGIIMILVFASFLKVLPTSGYVPFSENPGQNLRFLVLPALTLGVVVAAPLIRYLQGSIDEVQWATFVRTARGKGIGWGQTVMQHILPNALLPALTSLGITVGALLGGSVVVETVFAWPGIGQAVVDAVMKRDYAVVQTIVLLAAGAFVLTTLIVDVLYGVLDPRLRINQRGPKRGTPASPTAQKESA